MQRYGTSAVKLRKYPKNQTVKSSLFDLFQAGMHHIRAFHWQVGAIRL
ncbi:hypothetical protein Y047_5954 [Burkholderia pseudomallei MSHR3016]|nr:hypothetical protein Y047_5954 [Burkholderia pseudomallei MSHR3016]